MQDRRSLRQLGARRRPANHFTNGSSHAFTARLSSHAKLSNSGVRPLDLPPQLRGFNIRIRDHRITMVARYLRPTGAYWTGPAIT